jgi:hypothetical protein
MVEISQPSSRNFSFPFEFKWVGVQRQLQGLKASGFRQVERSRKDGFRTRGFAMKYLKYVAMLAVLMVPLAFTQAAQAQVSFGIGIGPGYAYGPPVCEYGYYSYYPYACAPYGYYGPDFFVNGVFIGAGPWYHSGWGRGYYGRGYYGHDGWGRGRGYDGRGYGHGYVGGGRGYVGGGHGYVGGGHGYSGGGGYHGSAPRGGGGYQGGGGHGGGRR